MSLDLFQAVVQGYTDRLFDQQVIAVQAGFWAGYYSKVKHPKSVDSVISSMHKKKVRQDKRHLKAPAPVVDVEGFLAREQRLQDYLNK